MAFLAEYRLYLIFRIKLNFYMFINTTFLEALLFVIAEEPPVFAEVNSLIRLESALFYIRFRAQLTRLPIIRNSIAIVALSTLDFV